MSRKTASFSQLLGYITGKGKVFTAPITHNLSADGSDIEIVNQEFLTNAQYCPPRKNGVVLYHEILSLSGKDRNQVTVAMLSDLAQKYVALRASKALVFGTIHFEDNPHVHLVISGNLGYRRDKLRLSKAEFARVKRELEWYQKEHYPELEHSLVFEQGGGQEVKKGDQTIRQTRTFSEYERDRRIHQQGRGELSRKDTLREKICSSLVAAVSVMDFSQRLTEHTISLYSRGSRLAGVVFKGKKYRFRTIGLDTTLENALMRWEQIPKRQKILSAISIGKTRQQYRGWGLEL